VTTRIAIRVQVADDCVEFRGDIDDGEIHDLDLAPDAERRIVAALRERLVSRGHRLPEPCRARVYRISPPFTDDSGESITIADARIATRDD
jgi:hypothetical protein